MRCSADEPRRRHRQHRLADHGARPRGEQCRHRLGREHLSAGLRDLPVAGSGTGRDSGPQARLRHGLDHLHPVLARLRALAHAAHPDRGPLRPGHGLRLHCSHRTRGGARHLPAPPAGKRTGHDRALRRGRWSAGPHHRLFDPLGRDLALAVPCERADRHRRRAALPDACPAQPAAAAAVRLCRHPSECRRARPAADRRRYAGHRVAAARDRRDGGGPCVRRASGLAPERPRQRNAAAGSAEDSPDVAFAGHRDLRLHRADPGLCLAALPFRDRDAPHADGDRFPGDALARDDLHRGSPGRPADPALSGRLAEQYRPHLPRHRPAAPRHDAGRPLGLEHAPGAWRFAASDSARTRRPTIRRS